MLKYLFLSSDKNFTRRSNSRFSADNQVVLPVFFSSSLLSSDNYS
jgi:hypothetical protein